MTTLIETLVEIFLFIIASYFMFYKSFLHEIGKQNAQLLTIEEKTRKIEEVKQSFTTELESIKSQFQKNNLTFQIHLTELIQRRFDRIDSLYIDLINLQNYVKKNLFSYNDHEDFQKKIIEFNTLYETADTTRKKCSLYISNALELKIINVLNGAYSAFTSFRGLYNTDTKKLGPVSIFDLKKNELMIQLESQNIRHLKTLETNVDMFPELLMDLVSEFKKQVFLEM